MCNLNRHVCAISIRRLQHERFGIARLPSNSPCQRDGLPELNMTRRKRAWHWPAFLLGPIWYLTHGMIRKGTWLSVICLVTLFVALPFILLYCGTRGLGDLYNLELQEKS